MAAQETHYEVLGVDHHSTAEQVKAAYQKMVLSLHPDKAGPGSQQRFQLLQQAWQVCMACGCCSKAVTVAACLHDVHRCTSRYHSVFHP